MSEPIVMFFGCIGRPGHYHWRADNEPWSTRRHGEYPHPWGGNHIDGGIGWGLHHKGGWTALNLPDFTVDNRGGSHAVLIAEGAMDEADLIERFIAAFPIVARRLRLDERVTEPPSAVRTDTPSDGSDL